MAALGLRLLSSGFPLGAASRGYSLVVVGEFMALASLVTEHGLHPGSQVL